MARCDALAAVTDEPGRITRTFHSPAMQQANRLVGAWMRDAGLVVREDAAFNLFGRWAGGRRGARVLLVGSHLDTVRNAGRYDGPLGVLGALAAVQHLRSAGHVLPFPLDVVGFSDEEGVRYQTTYLGSRAVAGTLTRADLARVEERGIARARWRPGTCLGYLELHIEQGPRLEARGLPVGVVTGIAGQSRLRVELVGRAAHAGTTPMDLRRDALAGAAELVLAAEACGVVATVGQLQVEPGVSNVVPAQACFTLDVRHAEDRRRLAAVRALHQRAREVSRRRRLRLTWTVVQASASVACDPGLTELLAERVAARGLEVLRLPSGAGHDAVALSAICPVAMLFVRCRGGISHHPDEAVRGRDVAAAIGVLADTLLELGRRHA